MSGAVGQSTVNIINTARQEMICTDANFDRFVWLSGPIAPRIRGPPYVGASTRLKPDERTDRQSILQLVSYILRRDSIFFFSSSFPIYLLDFSY